MRLIALTLLAAALAGCSWFRDPPPPQQTITPGSRILYNGGIPIWVVCDKGNLVYLSGGTPQVAVVPGGCPSGQP